MTSADSSAWRASGLMDGTRAPRARKVIQVDAGRSTAIFDCGAIDLLVDQKNVVDLGWILRRNDFCFAQQNAAILLAGNQEEILALGDVEQPGFDLVEPRERIHGAIEIALLVEVATGEENISKCAIGEIKPVSGSVLLEGVIEKPMEEAGEGPGLFHRELLESRR